MPTYAVTVKPGLRAGDACACNMEQHRYTVEADSKMSAISAAGKRWYEAECPNEQPAGCAYDRDALIAECSYSVKEI